MASIDRQVDAGLKSKSADWYDWAHRHGLSPASMPNWPYVNIYDARSFKSREWFRAALKLMSPDDPEFETYKTAAKYAPKEYESGFFDFRSLLKLSLILLATFFGFAIGLAATFNTDWRFAVIPAAVIVLWVQHFVRKYIALSK